MTTRITIDPPDPTLLDIQPKFWFRDEHGKAYPAELEYLLPENSILIEENSSGQKNKNLRVESQTYMRLPYFPGDIYFNDKAVVSKDPFFKGQLVSETSANLNNATLVSIGDEVIAPRVNAILSEFIYEGKAYLIKTINNGSGYAITADGKRSFEGGRSVISKLCRIFHSNKASTMLTKADLNPENPNDLRLLSCLGTLQTSKDIYQIGKNLKKDKPNPLLLGPMNNCDLDIVGATNWTVGPF